MGGTTKIWPGGRWSYTGTKYWPWRSIMKSLVKILHTIVGVTGKQIKIYIWLLPGRFIMSM